MKFLKIVSLFTVLFSFIQPAGAVGLVSSDKVIEFMGIKGLSFLTGIGLLALAGIIVMFIFWLFSLIDCLKRNFAKDGDKIAWVIVIIFLQIFGALLYHFIVKAKDKQNRITQEKVKKK